ncbi:MAG: N-acetylmuramoyl-L-alanine amidase [Desulfovibrio sp.]|nr:N-acetylmuramoyl-L-alanine amidase [Desulfovibrio sp.]
MLFLTALSFMVICFYDSGYTSLPPTGKRYELAKTSVQELRQDEKRAAQREPWEKLAAEFKTIYDTDPAWPNRPAALFRAAESLEELARRSLVRADARKAIECYETLAQRHADSRLADDALYRAAKLRAAWLKDDKTAMVLLKRLKSQYPKSDMYAEVLALEKALLASVKGRTAPEARQVANTDARLTEDDQSALRTPNAQRQMASNRASAPNVVRHGATLAEKAASMPPLRPNDLLPRYREAKQRLASLLADSVRSSQRQPWEDLCLEFLRIYHAKKDWAVSPGALYRAASSLESLAGKSHLKSEYAQARDMYLALSQEFPKSALADDALLHAATIDADILRQQSESLELLDAIMTLYADGDQTRAAAHLRQRLTSSAVEESVEIPKGKTDSKGSLPSPKATASKATLTPSKANEINPRLVSDMARQLGLTVSTVFIDAGHGGRDPGTHHNNVLEREISLDIALTLGRLLQANGMDVVYSRTRNSTVPLRQRTAMTNAANSDIFVSIHVNANNNTEVQGFETYYLDIAKNADAARLATLENADSGQRLGDMQKMLADVMLNARVGESRHLATDIQRRVISRVLRRKFSVRNNGVKSAPFLVLIGAQMPAVLVEVGYCTHKDEARNLATPQYRMALAEGIAEGILAYRDRLRERRSVQNSLTPGKANAI